ncbi:hypothetical protein K493DRAFT_23152 [Basidiobolus meristosporus CBS 931.73]|uniref:LON-domain-containing protein n=1 Tax=Basidiobolus meristosporus CBS 931.73 TaxID=1314790 RepID=A0A1Y1Z7P9_9FUNG|nr:hypothetical protein K493DRAFT_23152 [Basidiobolus meristosporus CBS 931.73]|eukprot:ORY06271.1 hypothetical protein K493DRAFT_23152 [Basidiobolus meristosporus CBS 931.73]
MVSERGTNDFQSPMMDSVLNHLTCFQCHHGLRNPITLPCGHSVCSECLPTSHENYPCGFVTPQPCLTCPFPSCSFQYPSLSGVKLDVTLANISQICLQEIPQPQAQKPIDSDSSSPNPELPTLATILQPEFECQICYRILFEPLTTSCGHTFCKECLLRTTDHSSRCPTCRNAISFSQVRDQQTNHALSRLVELLFPKSLYQRKVLPAEVTEENEAVPILTGGLVFPDITYSLHIFQPAHRLLIRRCLLTTKKHFGIVTRGSSNALAEYGTLVQIIASQPLPDGRFLIQVKGLHKLRILESKNLDGYHSARVDLVEDAALVSEKEVECSSTEDMILAIKAFVNSIGKSHPQLLARLNQLYGPPPQAMIPFSHWASCVIPIDDQEKYKLLCVDSANLRLLMIVRWIETTRKRWGFVGCPVM